MYLFTIYNIDVLKKIGDYCDNYGVLVVWWGGRLLGVAGC